MYIAFTDDYKQTNTVTIDYHVTRFDRSTLCAEFSALSGEFKLNANFEKVTGGIVLLLLEFCVSSVRVLCRPSILSPRCKRYLLTSLSRTETNVMLLLVIQGHKYGLYCTCYLFETTDSVVFYSWIINKHSVNK